MNSTDRKLEPIPLFDVRIEGKGLIVAGEVELHAQVHLHLGIHFFQIFPDRNMEFDFIQRIEMVRYPHTGHSQPFALLDDGRDFHGPIGTTQIFRMNVEIILGASHEVSSP